MILLDEDAHLAQRRLMLPAFHGEQVAAADRVMTEVAAAEVERWPRGEPVALHPRLQALTLEVILRTVFGLEEGARLDRLREHMSALLAIGASPRQPAPAAAARPRAPLGRGGASCAPRARADAELFALIDERRRDGAQRDDVLSLLLAARHEDGSPMAPQELRDELMTLLVAGHETTASQLAFAFERLVRTPAVLTRLTEQVAGGDGDAYLTATVQETLRRRPCSPTPRRGWSCEETEIGGRRYPAGVVPGRPTPTSSTTTRRSIPTRTPSGPSASSSSRRAPTRGSPSAAGAGAASARLRDGGDEGRPARASSSAPRRAWRATGASSSRAGAASR